MTGNVLKIIVGVTLGGFALNALIGLSLFTFINAAILQDDTLSAAKKGAQYVAGATPDLPDIIKGEEVTQPLLLNERALLSRQLIGTLGYGTDGWDLRYNTLQDGIALRPDLAQCLKIPADDCYTVSQRHRDPVFVNGDKRLYVKVSYFRSGLWSGFDRDEVEALHKQNPDRRWPLVMPGFAGGSYLNKEWVALEPWQGFKLERMENHSGKGAYFLKATLEGDGKVELNMITNAPLDEVKTQLAAMDLKLLRAMVAPVPFGGLDTFDAYVSEVLEDRTRRDRFRVLSDEEVSAKVAAMPAETRIEYASGLVNLAIRRGRSVFDYTIEYRAKGAEGVQDTRDYLAGRIAQDDVRYEALHSEHQRELPIGSCVTAKVETYCKDKAEDLRIALEVRRQAAAAQPLVAGDESYSEEKFRSEMQEIERQMEEALQRLVQHRAGD